MSNRLEPQSRATTMATISGIGALLLWATSIAMTRGLSENLGALRSTAIVYTIGGVVACTTLLWRRRRGRPGTDVHLLPRSYWLWCGLLFVVYTLAFAVAIGGARDRQQAIEVALINYLWPSLTLVFSVPLLGARPRPLLLVGLALAFSGVILAQFPPGAFDPLALLGRAQADRRVYGAALVAGLTWGLYNNLARKFASHVDGSGVPVFVLVSGLAVGALCPFHPEPYTWSNGLLAPLAYSSIVTSSLAYGMWDHGMRRGRIVLLASLSYFTPLMSTVVSCVILGQPFGPRLGLSCVLVICGAWICSRSLDDGARP